MKQFFINKFLLSFDNNIKHEYYETKDFYGIIIYDQDKKYDVLHNYSLGNRIIISDNNGGSQDIPFKKETFNLLPPFINVEEAHDK